MTKLTRPALAASTLIIQAGLSVGCTNNDPVDQITLETGESQTVTVATHCGYETLEIDINGSAWSTEDLDADPAGYLAEPAWPKTGDSTEMELNLVDQETLEATVPGSGVTHTYHPDASPVGCD